MKLKASENYQYITYISNTNRAARVGGLLARRAPPMHAGKRNSLRISMVIILA